MVSGRVNSEMGSDGMSFHLDSSPMDDESPSNSFYIVWYPPVPQFDSSWWRKMPAGDWGKLHLRPINEQKISQRAGRLGPGRVSPEFPTICNGPRLWQKPCGCLCCVVILGKGGDIPPFFAAPFPRPHHLIMIIFEQGWRRVYNRGHNRTGGRSWEEMAKSEELSK